VECGTEEYISFGVDGCQLDNGSTIRIFGGVSGGLDEDIAFEGIEIISSSEYLDLCSFGEGRCNRWMGS